jgi:hypothetical protein
MGAAASFLPQSFDESTCKSFAGSHYDDIFFRRVSGGKEVIERDEFVKALSQRTDAFFSFDFDEINRKICSKA